MAAIAGVPGLSRIERSSRSTVFARPPPRLRRPSPAPTISRITSFTAAKIPP